MNFFEKIIKFLQFEMEKPTMYGWFHILCLILTVLLTIYLIFRKKDDRKVLFVLSLIMLIFEVYKQISFSFDDDGWSYRWYAFPYQFCSTPMYVAFIASLVKKEKVKDCLYSFLATYSIAAGVSVMLYPSTVFIKEVLIDIQTMVHHGFMIVIGVYLIATKKVLLNIKTLFKGFIVFAVLVTIAIVGNIVTYYVGIDGGLELFYISPYHESILPVFDIISTKCPYIVFLSLYLFAFTLGASLPLLVAKLISSITHRKHKNVQSTSK